MLSLERSRECGIPEGNRHHDDNHRKDGPGDRWQQGHRPTPLEAAAFSLTQSLRSLLAARGIRVHAVLTGPTDTDMTRGFEVPKATARAVAEAIFNGVERDEEDIFPDPLAETVADAWRGGAVKALEGQFAALAAAAPAA